MSLSQIMEETMRAMAKGDSARVEELRKMHNEKVAEIRANKNKKRG